MLNPPPAAVGMPLADVDTPALLVDLDAFERNLELMARASGQQGLRLRPHSKTHKCPAIALRQVALGAVGVCCQKVSEAEAMVQGGVNDVLVSNQVVGAAKLARLAALARRARIGVCVDHAANVAALADAAAAAGATIDVLVEIDVGAERCGVPPGEAAVALAQQVHSAEHLRFGGLQSYQGAAQHIRDFDERKAAIEQAAESSRDTVNKLTAAGLPCPIVTGAGTGTYGFEASSGVYNELQAGSYIFMDADYGRNRDPNGDLVHEFEHSLYVYATVMSKPTAERAVVDAGLKALSTDSGLPLLADMPASRYARPSDEHGVLALAEADRELQLGAKLRLIPGHCDPTVNLHDWYLGIRNETVEAIWPITARGALW